MNLKDKRRRFDALRTMGCVACSLYGRRVQAAVEVHHLNGGGHAGQKRRGDEYTVALCSYHHRGEPPAEFSASMAEEYFGPSLARSSKRFRLIFGKDDELLAYTNRILEDSWTGN
jgi:hypothetical protein